MTKAKRPEDALLADAAPVVPWPTRKKSTAEAKAERLEQQLALGNSQEQACQWDKAREVYAELCKDYPESVVAKHRLAVVYDRLKRHTEAQRLYEEAQRSEPENAELVNDLGYSYFLAGKLEQASLAFERALELDPHNARFHNNLGMVHGHQGHYEQALARFRKAGSDADAYYNLAFVYASQEKHDEAKQAFQKALLADPTHEKARASLAAFERYERTPAELRDESDLLPHDSDSRWVAYVEGESAPTPSSGNDAQKGSARSTAQVLQAGSDDSSGSGGISSAGYMSNRDMQHMHYRSHRNEQ
jgi:Tfp pilus assembly protein PilF